MRTLSLAALLLGALAAASSTAAPPNGPPKHRPKPPPRPVQQPHWPVRGGPGHIPIQPTPRAGQGRHGRHATHITLPSGYSLSVVPGKPQELGVKVIYRKSGAGGLVGPLVPAPGLPLEYHVEVVPGSGRFTKAFAGTTAANGICMLRYQVPARLSPGMHRAYLQTPGNNQFLPSRTAFTIAVAKPPDRRAVTFIAPPADLSRVVVPGKHQEFRVAVTYARAGGGFAGTPSPAPAGLPVEYHVEVVPGSGRFTKALAGKTGKTGDWTVRYEVPKHFAPGKHRAYLVTPGDRQLLPRRTEFVITAVKPLHPERGGTTDSKLVKD